MNMKQRLLSHLKENTKNYLSQLQKYSQYTHMLSGEEILQASMYYFQAMEDLDLLEGLIPSQYLTQYDDKLDQMTNYANQVITKNINQYKGQYKKGKQE